MQDLGKFVERRRSEDFEDSFLGVVRHFRFLLYLF